MRLAAVKSDLIARGILDERALMSYATLTGSVAGKTFQNIVAVCFQADHLLIFRANLDNSLGELLLRCRYQDLTEFILCRRFLYSYTSFTCQGNSLRFYSYDKRVFLQGFRDAGLLS